MNSWVFLFIALLLILWIALSQQPAKENFYSFDFPVWQYGRNYYGGYSKDGYFYGRYGNYGNYNGYPYYFGYNTTDQPLSSEPNTLRVV
jgi:hypothetical protein